MSGKNSIEDMADRFLSAIIDNKLDDICILKLANNMGWGYTSEAADTLFRQMPCTPDNKPYYNDALSRAIWKASQVGYGIRYTEPRKISVQHGKVIANVPVRDIHLSRQKFDLTSN